MSELEKIKGKLKTVSKNKGLILEEQPDKWFNIDKNYNIDIDILNSFKGKYIDLVIGSSGFYIEVIIDQDKVNITKRKYIKTKTFANRELKLLANDINNFSKNYNVKATQTHISNEVFYAFIYYEVEE